MEPDSTTAPARRVLAEDQALYQQAVRYIDATLSDAGLDQAAVAAALSVSTRTLNRLFHEHADTFAGCLRRRRIAAAQRDLENPDLLHLSIADIGSRSGLTDPTHFSRLFRETTGQSPTEHRLNGPHRNNSRESRADP